MLSIPRRFQELSVLVADSHEPRLAWTRKLLIESGLPGPSIAADGIEAINHLSSKSIDLVLIDHSLKFVDGLELAEYILSNPSRVFGRPKLLLIADRPSEEMVAKAKALGFQGVLRRPFSRENFERHVAAALGLPVPRVTRTAPVEHGPEKHAGARTLDANSAAGQAHLRHLLASVAARFSGEGFAAVVNRLLRYLGPRRP
jgi:CheY-like chemotaxis protein